MYSYEYPRPAVTVDCVLFTPDTSTIGRAAVLLIQRKGEPFAGKWALPGGFVEPTETLETAARRELREETEVTVGKLWPVGSFGDPGRDPRGWTISAVYYALVHAVTLSPCAGDDAAAWAWHPLDQLPALAFDHALILRESIARLRTDLYVLPVAKALLPESFTGKELTALYQRLAPKTLKGKALRQRLKAAGLLEPIQRTPASYRLLEPMPAI